MPTLRFLPPIGDDIDLKDLDKVRDLVFHRGEEYWNSGSGEAGLDRTERNETAKLRLVFDKSLGFYIVYIDQKGERFTSLGTGVPARIVSPFVGGDPLPLPSKFFVPIELAWRVIEEFCNTGNRSSQISWLVSKDLNWNFGTPSPGS